VLLGDDMPKNRSWKRLEDVPLPIIEKLWLDYFLLGNCWFYVDNTGAITHVAVDEVFLNGKPKDIRHRD
jgi:hypothetical protein